MVITVHQALIQILTDPKAFLRDNLLQVGDFIGASGIKTAEFQTSQLGLTHNLTTAQRFGHVFRGLHKHGVQAFLFGANPKVNFQTTSVQVQFIQMYQYGGLAAIQWHPLAPIGPGSPNIVITTKLTGCSFLVRTSPAGGIECAHVQPGGAQTGQQLRQALSGLHAGNYERLFGRGKSGEKGYGDSEASTIVGVRRQGAWKIYAQRLVNQQETLIDVERIYPA